MTEPVKHVVLFCRENKADKFFRPIATRAVDDPNAKEDFQALRVQKIVDANRSGAERPEFGVGIQTVTPPNTETFDKFGPGGPIEASKK